MSDAPFRVLSLDGGGLRGLFSAAFLEHIERHAGKSIADHVELIAGTSTGAIIALGLATGMSAREVLAFYQEKGPSIFGPKRSLVGRIFRPMYANDRLIAALQETFGDRTLNDLQVPVCIPSYELSEGTPRVFKDDHNLQLHWGGRLPIWKVAAASAAAPLYLPTVAVEEHDHHIDGGIWANNPILVAITEALRYFDRSVEDIVALSVGTGSCPPRLAQRDSRNLGGWGWFRGQRIVNVVFDAQSRSAHYAAKLLLPQDRYVRVDADLSRAIPLDSYSAAETLIERGRHAGRLHRNTVDTLFFAGPPAVRSARDTESQTE